MKGKIKNEKQGFSGFKISGFYSSLITNHSLLRSYVLCLVSSVLLILSHPPYNCWFLAWIALVPLFVVLENKNFWQSFRVGYLFGLFYCFGMFWWFVHVTLPGMIVLNLFLALYFAFFAASYSLFFEKRSWLKVFLAACLWVSWEYIRATFLSGFGWATLGHTQYEQIWFIHLSRATGIFGVSFILIIFNQFFFYLLRFVERKNKDKKFLLMFGSILFLTVVGLIVQAPATMPSKNLVKIAVVQPNIAQEDKWDPFKRSEIMYQLWKLTREAVELNPDLIVWPESSLPTTPEFVDEYLSRVSLLVKEVGVPLLLGYVRQEEGAYFNSAGMMNKQGVLVQQYDKLHLVPFGEFVPLRQIVPVLSTIVPIEDISPGKDLVVFREGMPKSLKFSTLICFEDTVPSVARRLVNAGADVLVNITNDAWFKDTKAPWLHLQAAVFQAAALQRPLVRSANTGVSASISDSGRIYDVLTGGRGGATFQSGVKIFNVAPNTKKTFYLIFGDIFAYLCIACSILGVIINNINIKKSNRL